MKKLLFINLIFLLFSCESEYELVNTRPKWAVGTVNTSLFLVYTCENFTYQYTGISKVTVEPDYIKFKDMIFNNLQITDTKNRITIKSTYSENSENYSLIAVWIKYLPYSNLTILITKEKQNSKSVWFLWPYIINEEEK